MSLAELLTLVVCIGLSAFFSGSETALTALSEGKARQLIDTGERRYRALRLWVERPNRVLTTILVGNNVVNIGASALATVVTERVVQNQPIAVATGLMTLVVLVFGEITPKTFAKHNAERMGPAAMRALRGFYYVVWPLTTALTYLSRSIHRAMGQEVGRTGPFVTEEDLVYQIGLGRREGTLEEDEADMLTSIFEFGDTRVREIMVPRTSMIALDETIDRDELLRLVAEAGHSRIPVYRESIDDVCGVFYVKDLLKAEARGDETFAIADHVRKPYFVPESMLISDLLKDMQRRRTHLAIVTDEFGGTAGIVTLEDILEEIVGEIRDEFDPDETQFKVLQGGRVLVDGAISIHDLGERLGVEFPESANYDSLGGFLTEQAGRVPEPGTKVPWDGMEFVVKDGDERKVSWVELERRSAARARARKTDDVAPPASGEPVA